MILESFSSISMFSTKNITQLGIHISVKRKENFLVMTIPLDEDTFSVVDTELVTV